ISDLKVGDVVEIAAKFESTSTGGWGGGLGAACADEEGNWKQVQFSNDSPEITLTVTVPATEDNNPNTGAQVQLWWGDEDAEVNVYIESVTKKDAPDAPDEPDAPTATLKNTDADKTFSFLLSDYISGLKIGDVVEIAAKFESTSTGGWGGGLGAACADEEGNWKQVQFSNDSPEITLTVTVPATEDNNPNTGAQIQLWWGDEDAGVDVYIVSVTRAEAISEANTIALDENDTEIVTKSNALALTGKATKNPVTLPDSDNDDAASVSGNESVSGNNSLDTENDSTTAVSGNDSGNEENASDSE
ncbi:MAG: hypothetical protein K2H45_07605, partial [Acetatifactor sp.]|nr:hypothetical protein [Acetatifactor sp.]